MIVIDASVLIAAFVEDSNEAVWARQIASEPELHSPELVMAEVANGLRRSERIQTITSVEADLARSDLLRLGLKLHSFAPFAERIWEMRHNLTCYDAWYVALAESLDCPMVTLDRRIGRSGIVDCEVITPD